MKLIFQLPGSTWPEEDAPKTQRGNRLRCLCILRIPEVTYSQASSCSLQSLRWSTKDAERILMLVPRCIKSYRMTMNSFTCVGLACSSNYSTSNQDDCQHRYTICVELGIALHVPVHTASEACQSVHNMIRLSSQHNARPMAPKLKQGAMSAYLCAQDGMILVVTGMRPGHIANADHIGSRNDSCCCPFGKLVGIVLQLCCQHSSPLVLQLRSPVNACT